MEEITIGQIASALALIVAILGGVKYLKGCLVSCIQNEMKPIKEKLTAAEEKVIVMESKIAAVEEISYITLSHMKTGNNKGEMQKVLDKYVTNIIRK